MKSRATFLVLILVATAGALVLRLPRLDERPMHSDEAVQALKAAALAETGVYRYDPVEYHGPTLYYLTLPSMRLSAGGRLADSHERAFRIVPVFFGVALILLLLLMADGLGRSATVCAALLTAVSPAMVFYSRFYIQEMLLTFFTFAAIAAGWRYAQSRRLVWALLCGASIGLMHSTKETCIIAFGSMLAALALTLLSGRRDLRQTLNPRHLAAGVAAGVVVSAVLFSSFFTNPRGPLDSILTYLNYLHRGAANSVHAHPWHYYLKMLLYTKYAPGPWWSEGLILALFAAALVAIFTRSKAIDGNLSLLRFIAAYTLFMTAAYSLIPYKTPWCMLGFLQGMILLAGVGAAALVRSLPGRQARVVACILIGAAGLQLALQACRANFQFYCDNRNPYVYAHPVRDHLHLVARVEDIAGLHPDKHKMIVKVIAPDDDYWPLPWGLRRFERVGYWSEVPDAPDAPVIIASPQVQPALDKKLRDTYQISCYGLRPRTALLLYVRTDLWEAFLKTRTKP